MKFEMDLLIVVMIMFSMLQRANSLVYSQKSFLRNTIPVTRVFSTRKDALKDAPATKKQSKSQHQDDIKSTITPRTADYSAWYNDVIAGADLVDSSAVRGCMVIKPYAMSIWELLRNELDNRIKAADVSNAYFPLFIPKSFLAKEAEHVDGFAKECAIVTHHRLKQIRNPTTNLVELIPDPDAELEEPLIVRPTSETIIWNMFSKWISSHRDLPLKINQWANVVRWEMRTRPFLRTSEFLWQEGHTAHASSDEAVSLSLEILDMYADVCKELLALPTIKGEKSPSERFAGAVKTFTIEAMMQNGFALQSGTSHFLGQNFAKAFDVYYQTEKSTRELVWATSWGVSTRLLGALIMTHSDDQGLVLPPNVAPFQAVIIPIITGKAEKDNAVLEEAKILCTSLKARGIRVKLDDRNYLRAGAKYFEYERKGVPLRIELGPRDLENKQVTIATRWNGEKISSSIYDKQLFANDIELKLQNIQNALYERASSRLANRTFQPSTYLEMKSMLESETSDNVGFYLVPWKCDADNEAKIKEDCKATIRCYPADRNKDQAALGSLQCFYSGEPATHFAIFARAY